MSHGYECFLLNSHVNALKTEGYDLVAGTIFRDWVYSASILIFSHPEEGRRVQLVFYSVQPTLEVVEDLMNPSEIIWKVSVSDGGCSYQIGDSKKTYSLKRATKLHEAVA